MSVPKNNLDEVLRREYKANIPLSTTLMSQGVVRPKPSKFKPAIFTQSSEASICPSSFTGSRNPRPFTPTNTAALSLHSNISPMNSVLVDDLASGNVDYTSAKRTSSDAFLTSKPIPSKKGKIDLPYKEENSPQGINDTRMRTKGTFLSSPSGSSLVKYPDLTFKSISALKDLLLFNNELNTNNMNSIIKYHCDGEKGIDIVTLEAIRQVLNDRISAITTALQDREEPNGLSVQGFSLHNSEQTAIISSTPRGLIHETESPVAKAYSDTFEQPVTHDLPRVEESVGSQPHAFAPTASPVRIDHTASPYYGEIIRTLKGVFSLHDFRKNQLEAITGTLEGRDVFVLMPTGGGKSLCYQVPAVCKSGKTKGVTFVVSPLLSLMHDQAESLRRKGVDVLLWNSEKTSEDAQEIRHRLNAKRKPSMVYITPEKLKESQTLKSILTRLYEEEELARFVVDEAHCISTWGRDFRDAYQALDTLRKEYSRVPIMALTATAKKTVVDDIIERLGMSSCLFLTQSFNRQNLHYDVRPKTRNVLEAIAGYINGRHPTSSGIIYCFSRSNCEDVARILRQKHQISARHYHAGMSPKEKISVQSAWQNGECSVIVATIAFGMGIDKPNVRFVIHHFLPKSMEGYYQETGRAGRDGLPADCILYYNHADSAALINMIRHDKDRERLLSEDEIKRQENDIRSVIQYCQNVVDCRRVQLLGYFGETFDPKDCHRSCNNCLDNSEVVTQDISVEAMDAIRLVKSLTMEEKAKITQNYCSDVFRGANLKEIRERRHHEHPLYGAGKHLPREMVERLFGQLLGVDAFRLVSVQNNSGWHNNYLELGATAELYMKGKPLTIAFKSGSEKLPLPKKMPRIKTKISQGPALEGLCKVNDIHVPAKDDDTCCKLFKDLQALRQTIADEEQIEDPEEIIKGVTVQMLSITFPQDSQSMKAIIETDIQEFIDAALVRTYVEDRWQRYGQRFLDICIKYNKLE